MTTSLGYSAENIGARTKDFVRRNASKHTHR